ncbi:MAG: hypothetical protein WDM92_06115 [Caulobacteraceae bacterium]
MTVRTLSETLRDAMAPGVGVAFSGLARAGDPPSLVADAAATRALGFEPAVALDDGVRRYAAWAAGEIVGAAG